VKDDIEIRINTPEMENEVYEVHFSCPANFGSLMIGMGKTLEEALRDANETITVGAKLLTEHFVKGE
jgi:predicted RNase H-like HicB family nuclease